MKTTTLSVLAALTFTLLASQAIAQSQEDQQACEGDVYSLCQDKIPDQDAIVACLRKQWSKVSKECRQVMINYKKNHGKEKHESGSASVGKSPTLGN